MSGTHPVIGPALPPHLLKNPLDESAAPSKSNDEEKQSSVIGPTLPPHLLKQTEDEPASSSDEKAPPSPEAPVEDRSTTDSSTAAYGPALPPHLQNKSTTEDSDDDEHAYGPLPSDASHISQAHLALEERALQIKLSQLDSTKDAAKVREEWMLELPDVGAGRLGLGPRQFRKNQKPDFSDRSSWTDTPEQKAKKSQGKTETPVDLKREAELQAISKRDEEQAQMSRKHSGKRKQSKSLLEMHQDKLKKKKQQDEKEGAPTRRPFSRDIDLKVNQFDDAQKKSIMKKAMHLDDRFSKGQSKYL